MKTKRIITYPPRKVVYKNASTSTTNTNSGNVPPTWLRTRDYLLTGGSSEYETRRSVSVSPASASASNMNMRSASRPSGEIPYYISTMMYGTQTLETESPSREETERSLPYKYPTSEAARNEMVRDRIRSAAKQMNMPTPKPYWLNLLERV